MRKLVGAIFSVMMLVSSSAFAAKVNPLYQPAGNEVAGNPNGSVTVVEFFDYNCGYCRAIYPQLNNLIEKDHNVRLLYREYPVLSPRSLLPAQAALAAQNQGKYSELHSMMMSASSPLSENEINDLAKSAGINTAKLDSDMNSNRVMDQIQTNLSIGQALNIQGVPSFIIARTTPPSKQKAKVLVGPSIEDLQQAISRAENSR
ncbi:MAG: DsbA family protein [Gammaproteobacteria bacterium]|nr:DsbA family protein [Gammaproteobacteria bacterium]